MSLHVETIAAPLGQSFRLLRWRDNLKDVEQYDASGPAKKVQGAGERWHLHREMEMTYIERGQGLRVVGDSIAPFCGPELVLLGSNLPHCWHGLRRSSGYALQFHWPLEHPLRALPEFSALRVLFERAKRGLHFGAPPMFGERLSAMLQAHATVRLGMLVQMLGELAAMPTKSRQSISRVEFGLGEDSHHQSGIERVIRHVLEHYAEPHPLSEVLKIAGMSKATFARQFPRYTGCHFTGFLNRVRLDHARQRILAANESVSAAAFDAGFNNLSYFNRGYLQAFGVTPTADRCHAAEKLSKSRSRTQVPRSF
jgi:AraC-like DNA-binding protein